MTAEIGNNPGFVDDTYMNIVPTPGAIALLGLAGLAGRRRPNEVSAEFTRTILSSKLEQLYESSWSRSSD